jgi:hypothetical protein
LEYTPSADFSGMVTLSLVTNDLGNTGSGGQLTDTDMVAVIVNKVDVTPPTVNIANVSPATRAGAVDRIVISFSEPVREFEIGDLSLRRFTNNSVSLLPGSATLTTADNVTYTLGNLGGLTANSGIYTLTLPAAASGIVDQGGGHPLAQGASIQWVNGAGDANTDNEFNQFDIIALLQAGLYLTNLPATWSTGDFDGNGRFDQFDIILASQTQPPHYLQGPFAARSPAATSNAADAVYGQIGNNGGAGAGGDATLVDAAMAEFRLI